jgi:hypothetical protein
MTTTNARSRTGDFTRSGNPYLAAYTEVRDAVARTTTLEEAAYSLRTRERLVRTYAWAIPTEAVIARIVAKGPVVEMGAGGGYWSALVQRSGGDITPFDAAAPARTWCEVQRGDPSVLDDRTEDALLLVWPPFRSDMAAQCLTRFRGSTLLYAGEGAGGCCGDVVFFRLLERHWQRTERHLLPTWPHIHDTFSVWVRR